MDQDKYEPSPRHDRGTGESLSPELTGDTVSSLFCRPSEAMVDAVLVQLHNHTTTLMHLSICSRVVVWCRDPGGFTVVALSSS